MESRNHTTLQERPWVARITCPKQKALALAVPALCDLCGLVPSDLEGGRKPLGADERKHAVDGFRGIVAGSIVSIGRDLGLQGRDLYGSHACDLPRGGHTQIRELQYLHRATLKQAEQRFEIFRASGGLLGRTFAAAFAKIRQETLLLASQFAKDALLAEGTPVKKGKGPKGQKTKKLGG